MTFNETGLKPEILQAISDLGYTEATPIQAKTIPVILEKDHDLVALAQTGTGKTAAFGLPVISQIDITLNEVQAMILAPTRELCVQISKDLEKFAKYTKGLRIAAVYGGAGIEPQLRNLRKGAHIVVGTPGRTLDFIRRGSLQVGSIRWLVLDEADEMLKMGFQDDMDAILAATPSTRQTLLFSATMPQEIVGLTRRYMKDPEEISIAKNVGSATIEHWYYVTNVKDRYMALKRIADMHPEIYGIVFCRTRAETQEIAEQLIADHYSADALHGDLSQERRDMVMSRFRSGHLQLLIATDVAARGLDVDNLTHIINFRLPDQLDSYIHRSGRTGRAGRKGVSISLLGPREVRSIKTLERQVGKEFVQKRIPTAEEIIAKQLHTYVAKVEKIEVDEEKIQPFLEPMYKQLEWMSREELIKHFLSIEFNRFIDYYRNAKDINIQAAPTRPERREKGERGERPERGAAGENMKWTRFFINLGHKQRLNPPRLMSIINGSDALFGAPIGRIEILNNFSFFEIGGPIAENIPAELTGLQVAGVSVHVEPAQAKEMPAEAPRGKQKGSFRKEGEEGRKDYSSLKKKEKAPKKTGGFHKGKGERKKSVAVWGGR